MKRFHTMPPEAPGKEASLPENWEERKDIYRILAESAQDYLFLINRDFELVYTNPAGATLFGSTPDKIVGRPLSDLFDKTTFERQKSNIQKVFDTGEPVLVEHNYSLPNGDMWLNARLVPVWDDSENAVYVLGTSLDITERKQAEKEQLVLQDELQTLVETRTQELEKANENLKREIIERERAQKQVTIQNQIAVIAGSTNDLVEALSLILKIATKLIGVDAGGVYVVDKVGNLELVAHTGLSEKFIEKVTHYGPDTPESQLIRKGDPVYTQLDKFPQRSAQQLKDEGITTVASVPVVYKDKTIAVFNLASRTTDEYEQSVRRTMENISAQMGGAIARLKAEKRSREREATYRALFEKAYDAIYLIDPVTTEIIDCNPRASGMLGFGHDELCKKTIIDLHPKDEQRIASQRFRQTAEIGVLENVSGFHHRHQNGNLVPIEVSASMVEVKGQMLNLSLVRDISERLRSEEQRHRLEQQMKNAQKLESLGVLAGGIAHDFNNLLVGVLGNADLARMQLGEDSGAHSHLESITQTALQLSTLTNQMLAYSGRGHFVVGPTDVSHVAWDIARLLRISLPKKVTVNYQLAADLPKIEADRNQLQQVLMNLITNAAEAIGDNAGIVDVSTSVEEVDRAFLETVYMNRDLPVGPYVMLTVSDTGEGMADDVKERIFDPFFSTKFTGRGLGLAAVLGIVHGHGGTIKVDSTPGKGTQFHVLFPPLEEVEQAKQTQRTSDTEGLRGSETILLVDDEETVIDVATAMLENGGYTVLRARDGREALNVLLDNIDYIDLVMLDLKMPEMDGLEAQQEMEKIQPSLPIIITSGYEQDEVGLDEAKQAQMDFLKKPYTITALLTKVRETLDRR